MFDPIRQALMDALEGFGMFEEDYVLELDRPKDAAFGDVSTNVALILAKKLGRKPRELAGEVAAALSLDRNEIESVEIAGPGFINFRLARRVWTRRLVEILEAAGNFGASDAGQGTRINVEFISANPTGPFNIVSARAAAVGSALVRTLRLAGYRAHAEFYCNDAGRQVQLLGYSLRARYAQVTGRTDVEVPEEGYRGEYVLRLAEHLHAHGVREEDMDVGDAAGPVQGDLPRVEGAPDAWLALDEEASAAAFGRYALRSMIRQQRQTCEQFGVQFDAWVLESRMHAGDHLTRTVEALRGDEHVVDRDGAVWFQSEGFGDEKDRVLVKADGAPTYFLADIAYHAYKRERGFEKSIDLLGPDHHGYIARMEGAMQAIGYAPGWLEIILLQQVNLIQDGKPLEMSKRAGRLVTMDELIAEVGADAAKYFFLARKNTSHLDFDLDLAKQQSNDNPVYYVKYAHARICSVLRNAEARGLDPSDLGVDEDSIALEHPTELDLVRLLSDFPERVVSAATSREMLRLTGYATEVATAFTQFYHHCMILDEDEAVAKSRLALSVATRIVLANTLGLIGVEAPERM